MKLRVDLPKTGQTGASEPLRGRAIPPGHNRLENLARQLLASHWSPRRGQPEQLIMRRAVIGGELVGGSNNSSHLMTFDSVLGFL